MAKDMVENRLKWVPEVLKRVDYKECRRYSINTPQMKNPKKSGNRGKSYSIENYYIFNKQTP